MSIMCKEIIEHLEKFASPNLAEEWDNIGLLLGRYDKEVSKVFVALEVTNAVIKQAIHDEVDMIICHHPIIFKSLSRITTDDYIGNNIYELIRNDISVYCMHTNMDNSKHGLSNRVAELLELKHQSILGEIKMDNSVAQGLGRIGELIKPVSFENFIINIKKIFKCDKVRYAGNKVNLIRKVAICPGSGMDLMRHAYNKGADVYITGDLKYHQAVEVKELGFLVIDADHFYTEKIFEDIILEIIDEITKRHEVEIIRSFFTESPIKYI